MTDSITTYLRGLPVDTQRSILRVAKSHGAVRVAVFGSFTRNEETPAGDLDLLVDLEPGRSLLDLVAMKQELEDLLGMQIDVVTRGALSPYIREDVLRNLTPL